MTRVALVACSKSKLDHAAPARELYTGDLFRKSRDWVERRPVYATWAILSAKHGVVMPDDVLEPYDATVIDMSDVELRAWENLVVQQIVDRWGLSTIYTLLAGAHYRIALRRLPMVEDVFGHWLRWRREVERKRHRVGIGWLKRELARDRGYPDG